jgi:NAD-dependent DNA ligase
MARHNETSDFLDVVAVMEPTGKPLKGMRICISGHLSKDRSSWVELIEQAGGIFHKSIVYGTTHLCTNADWSEGSINGKVSSKYAKAQQFGVKIINEATLLEMIVKGDEKT